MNNQEQQKKKAKGISHKQRTAICKPRNHHMPLNLKCITEISYKQIDLMQQTTNSLMGAN